MKEWFKVEVSGEVIEWRDGKFKCENQQVLGWIQDCISLMRKFYDPLLLDGSVLTSCVGCSPEENWITAFAFLQTYFGNLKFLEGERPTWEKLGWKQEEGVIT